MKRFASPHAVRQLAHRRVPSSTTYSNASSPFLLSSPIIRRRAMCRVMMLLPHQHSHASSLFAQQRHSSHEPITLDMISIETMEDEVVGVHEGNPSTRQEEAWRNHTVEDDHHHHNDGRKGSPDHQHHSNNAAGASSSFNSTATTATTTATSRHAEMHHQQASHQEVHTVDSFSKGKVTNYLRRVGVNDATLFRIHREEAPIPAAFFASMATEERSSSSCSSSARTAVVYRAKVPVKLPQGNGSLMAEGIAELEKDAENLAFMHAEQLLDAMGVALFRLPSAQTKHAEAARKQGRYAPMPGDAVKPEGSVVLPPPLRMVTSAAGRAALGLDRDLTSASGILGNGPGRSARDGGSGEDGAGVSSFSSSRLFRGIMEAEIVETTTTTSQTVTSSLSSSFVATHHAEEQQGTPNAAAAATDATPPPGQAAAAASQVHDDDDMTPLPPHILAFRQRLHYPWRLPNKGVQVLTDASPVSPSSSALPAPAGDVSDPLRSSPQPMSSATTGGGVLFDATENGLFQMVNLQSTRVSSTIDALLLPNIYEGAAAYDRLTVYFLAYGVDIKKQVTVSHVVVPGFSTRMYVAEIHLLGGITVLARGKGQERQGAIYLAAMHAELLLDALGKPLFPKDPARQQRHADAAHDFGRWAVRPSEHPNTWQQGVEPPPAVRALPLPLPLKQQVGGDEVWMDPSAHQKGRKSFGERVVYAHNELNTFVNEFLEVHPHPALLQEAREILVQWQRRVAKNTDCPNLFVVTRMGDVYRCSTITPVPKEFGVRGGNAVGKTIDQAIGLASLHALDTLYALGIPISTDPETEAKLRAQRDALGLWTQPREELPAALECPTMRLPQGHKYPRYVPGYLQEGALLRNLPHHHDVLTILKLSTERDFALFDLTSLPPPPPLPKDPTAASSGTSEEELQLIAQGNEIRQLLQMYLKRVHGRELLTPCALITGYAKNTSVYNVVFLPIEIPSDAVQQQQQQQQHLNQEEGAGTTTLNESTGILSSAATSSSSSSSSLGTKNALRCPNRQIILAVGLSLKKKDAERMCYLHAALILKAYGVDLTQERKLSKMKVPSTPPSVPSQKSSSSKKQLPKESPSNPKQLAGSPPRKRDAESTPADNATTAPSTASVTLQPTSTTTATTTTPTTTTTATLSTSRKLVIPDIPLPIVHPSFIRLQQSGKMVTAAPPTPSDRRNSNRRRPF